MQQLYQEMFELRKSITSCMDMQLKLQSSIQEEVSTAIKQRGNDKKLCTYITNYNLFILKVLHSLRKF